MAVEIGFGHTSNLMMLAEKGFSCIGIEVSEEAVRRGADRLGASRFDDSVELRIWDGSKIDLKTSSVDLLVGLQSVYYNVDFEFFKTEVFRVLKPGGRFFFSFFSRNHDYMQFIDLVDTQPQWDVVRWNDAHPNPLIRGAQLVSFRSADQLREFWEPASPRVFTEESDQLPLFQSWWYVEGIV